MKQPHFTSLGAALAAWSLLFFPLQAATIVDWDGTGSYTGAFQAQGSLGGSTFGVAFDDTNPQVSGSTGTSSVFYGGMIHENSSSGAYNYQAPSAGSLSGVYSTGIHARMNGVTTDDAAAFLAYWKAADFLVEPGSAVMLDSSSSMKIAFDSLSSSNLQARWVVETSTGFFITSGSVTNINSGQAVTFTQNDMTTNSWLTYDPAVDMLALGSASAPDLSDVIGVGFRLDATGSSFGSTFRTRIGEFEVNATVVPEPTTAVSLLLGATLVVVRRRRHV